jgi:transcriptional regulator GlxA family with amidase domain
MRDRMAETSFAVLIYEGVEPIDVGATFGVLSMARRIAPGIRMLLVAEHAGPVMLANGLEVIADHDYDTCRPSDVLIVTGGPGWSQAVHSEPTRAFIRRHASDAVIASVCTGSLILAASGLLEGRSATTKREVAPGERQPTELMRDLHPGIKVIEARLVDEGNIVTGGGVTLAIDTTLHLIERFYGSSVADETARIIEYRTAWEANKSSFPALAYAARGPNG